MDNNTNLKKNRSNNNHSNNTHLESIIVNVEGSRAPDELQNSLENLRLTQEIIDYVKFAREKCETIKQIDGEPAAIVGMIITGTEEIQTIGLQYHTKNDQAGCKKYTKQEFYRL